MNKEFKVLRHKTALVDLVYAGEQLASEQPEKLSVTKNINTDIDFISAEDGRAIVQITMEVLTEPEIFKFGCEYKVEIIYEGETDNDRLKRLAANIVDNDVDFLIPLLTEKTFKTYIFMPHFRLPETEAAEKEK